MQLNSPNLLEELPMMAMGMQPRYAWMQGLKVSGVQWTWGHCPNCSNGTGIDGSKEVCHVRITICERLSSGASDVSPLGLGVSVECKGSHAAT